MIIYKKLAFKIRAPYEIEQAVPECEYHIDNSSFYISLREILRHPRVILTQIWKMRLEFSFSFLLL